MNRVSNVDNSACADAQVRICADATALLHWIAAQKPVVSTQDSAVAVTRAKATVLSMANLIFTSAIGSDASYRFYEQLCIHMPAHDLPSGEFMTQYRAWRDARANPQAPATPLISIQALRRVRSFMEIT